jgi:hypothetical protein
MSILVEVRNPLAVEIDVVPVTGLEEVVPFAAH